MAPLGFSFLLATLLVCISHKTEAQEIDDLDRSPDKFSYYQLGRHVPPRSGHPGYSGARTVIAPDIGLPLAISPTSGEHMYCNTQVWGFREGGLPGGKSNDLKNFTFPWTDTFCEIRWAQSQRTRACGPSSPISHQGTDCRPPKPVADKYWMVAVEDGKIAVARKNLVEVVGTKTTIRWKYRHGNMPVVTAGATVRKGDKLAQVADLTSTPIHLHLESERPAGTDLDNFPSLIVAYQKALNNPFKIDGDQLALDPAFEILADNSPGACGEAENAPALSPGNDGFSTLWCHNGSILGLSLNGDERKFVYFRPKTSSLRETVKADPILVTGKRVGNLFTGSAKHFHKQCGVQEFAVTGNWPDSSNEIILTGTRKQFSSDCNFRMKAEMLSFSMLRDYVKPVPDDRKSLTEITRNWGAITMPSADRTRWLPYVRSWPGLLAAGEVTDSQGGVIPAFETDEAGVGLWWYWLIVRKGFGPQGRPTLTEIARGIAGDHASDETIANYRRNYWGLTDDYFGRLLNNDEPIDIGNAEPRWALAQVMFHHESGRTPLIDRDTFARGVQFGNDVISGTFKGLNAYKASSSINTPVEDTDISARYEKLQREYAELASSVKVLEEKINLLRDILK